MLLLLLTLLFIIGYTVFSVQAARQHEKNIKSQFKHRVHVNGIRGKSSVTRLISGAMREAGIRTVGKTTGTNARIMVSHTIDWPVERKEANISEQRKLIRRYLGTKYKAIVFECMAVNPLYQKYLEDKIMFSTICVITNVREDHIDQMGRTLPEIARSLSATIPRNGHLVTAEKDREILEVFQQACNEKGATLHAVGRKRVWNDEMAGFDHFEYKDNVAITIHVAGLMGIDRKTALRGMKKSLPDPGAFKLQSFAVGPNTIYWANLFAINDRESFVKTVKTLSFSMGSKHKKAIILNNRKDRPERVAQFIDIALNNFKFDYVFTFGDYERRVVREVKQHKSRNKPKVICLGNSTQYRDANGKLLWQKIQENIPGEPCLLVGAVNIHTMQSQNLLKTLSKEEAVYAR
jgi:poly-gamma-glutamate synthase PgsB/CapB